MTRTDTTLHAHRRAFDHSRLPPVLRLPAPVLGQLVRLARQGHPHEVCGLLVGVLGDETIRVERISRARNLAIERLADRYILDPDDFLAADLAARRDDLDIVGIWHTHPDHPALPSETDLEAAWESYTYLILSVRRDGVTDIKAWQLDEGDFVETSVEELES